MNREKVKAGKYLDLALYSFGGLGLELIILMIEGKIYGTTQFKEWGLGVTILHWIVTCSVWGLMSYFIYHSGKKNGCDLLSYKEQPKLSAIIYVGLCMLICWIISYVVREGQFKIVAEYISKRNSYGELGWLAYGVQYIYYFFETVLVAFVIGFGQQYGEEKFNFKGSQTVPWGGILCGISWGLVHILTKGSLDAGLVLCFCSILYGTSYLLLKKNMRYAYVVITLMFVL